MTPEDLIDELRHKVVLAPDERYYLESVSADYLLSLPLAIRKRLSKLHETIAG